MVTFVLDASAVLRFLDGEAGAQRVKQIFKSAQDGSCRVVISAVNWGEVIGVVAKRHGRQATHDLLTRFTQHSLEVIPVTAERASRAALIKVSRNIPYADAFGVELGGESPEHRLVTADFDAKPADQDIVIEFLPAKP
ncbi:PIN domain-containing protein [Granulicella sp. dw_53]|uniref:PIN domain-containing protein n=1 Tax=Granulicella sp. dw_53 TaxID=2719792 RepID=UPI001BD2DF29|nr:PIN domain-containing protein [Granulicella sp. dw_53]